MPWAFMMWFCSFFFPYILTQRPLPTAMNLFRDLLRGPFLPDLIDN